MDRTTAMAALETSQARRQKLLRQGRFHSVLPDLQAFAARYWLEETTLTLPARRHESRRVRALKSLLIGQLLMARRRAGAMEHLDLGFELATPLFRPADYFKVMQRHALLRLLPTTPEGLPPADLETLLTTARVAQRLGSRPVGKRHPHDPNDVYG